MTETGHSDVLTEGIRVRVAAEYLSSQSDPDRDEYAFVYRVMLDNEGDQAAKLLARHWIITDAHGEVRHVRGPGVVGKQPELLPGEGFEYMSGCELATAWGTMEGTFEMRRPDGAAFQVRIGRFFLAESTAPIESLDGKWVGGN